MTAPRISVVVPVYNVAGYLEACLESLAGQTMGDLEVVLVEDGSTDESPLIAERFVARDPRFRLVRQANAGLGAARNTGIDHASGEFIAFVDSDDVLPPNAYELLLGVLDRTGSDFASGNAQRLTSFGRLRGAFLARAFTRSRLRTHITRFPILALDRTAWNKLYRREFWDRHGFRFPEGVLYEDTAVTLPAHYLATSVDVIAETVYFWRMRDGADLSITQRRTEAKALRDRVAAVDSVSRFLAERRLNLSKSLYDHIVLRHDFRYFLEVLPAAGDAYRDLFLELVNDFLDRADGLALEQPLAIDRLKWQLVRRRSMPELLEVLRFADEQLIEAAPLRRGRHWYGDYPYRTSKQLRIPGHVYRLGPELAPVFRVNSLRFAGNELRVEGYAYIDLIGAPRRDFQSIELLIRPKGSRLRGVRLKTETTQRPDVTANAAQRVAGLDWTGFVATIDVERLLRRGRGQDGSWEVGVAIRARGITRRTWRAEPAPLHPAQGARLTLGTGVRVLAGLTTDGEFVLRSERPARVESCSLDNGVLQLEGDAGPLNGAKPVLRVTRGESAPSFDYPVHVSRSGGRSKFLARVPAIDLVREVEAADAVTYSAHGTETAAWEVYLADRSRVKRLLLGESAPESSQIVNGRVIAVERTRDGHLQVVERSLRPVLTGLEWSPADTLILTGHFSGPAPAYDFVLAARGRSDTHVLPLSHTVETGRFRAVVPAAAMPTVGGVRPLSEGTWDFRVGEHGTPPEAALTMVAGDELLEQLPISAAVGPKRFQVGVAYDLPVLAVGRDLEAEERGGFRQRQLRSSFYPAQRRRELREAVLYDCFGGRSYSDSPRAVHEELVRRGAPIEHLWVVRDAAFRVPESAVPVRELSREYYDAFARAKYVVTNDHWPRWVERRPDQTWLQTWHGAPLKRHGHDLADRRPALREYRRVIPQRSENWQYVVSPGPFATPILERAFPIGGEILETGLPRTDVLSGPNSQRRAKEVKRRLGLGDERIVLYAPTFRDDLDYAIGFRPPQQRDQPTYQLDLAYRDGYRLGQLLDLEALSRALGDDHVLLFRKHPRIADAVPADVAPYVRDVSDYPDAMELLLVADVLVTDYSSWIFDYAATGRPIVLFTPDLEAYRDEIRGFSIDLEAVAPGPLLRSTDAVIEALRDSESVWAEYGDRYEAFVASYCPFADGDSSARVVDRVFSS